MELFGSRLLYTPRQISNSLNFIKGAIYARSLDYSSNRVPEEGWNFCLLHLGMVMLSVISIVGLFCAVAQ